MTNEILELIKEGENSLIEFKNENFHPDSLSKEIVAFSNVRGGSIIIGVNDDGIISGVTSKEIEQKIVNICRNNIVPSIIPDIISFKIGVKLVYKIKIFKDYINRIKCQTRINFIFELVLQV